MLPSPPVRKLGAPPSAFALERMDDAAISRLIAEADRHAASAYTEGLALGLDVLGDIALPPGSEARVDRAQMRALAALYLAADLEPAGLISSVEMLAGLAASGALRIDLGSAAPLVHQFWRDRHQRIDASERLAFFSRLFGAAYGAPAANAPANDMFEPLMLNFCEALYRLDGSRYSGVHGDPALQSRLREDARQLTANLVDAGGGITAFLAAEVLRTQKAALEILKHSQIRAGFMARDIWGVIAGVDRLAGRRPAEPRAFVRRGQAGMNVIAWLADAAGGLATSAGPFVSLDDPVLASAVDWLQASLAISERQAQAPAMPPPHIPQQPSWADIGA